MQRRWGASSNATFSWGRGERALQNRPPCSPTTRSSFKGSTNHSIGRRFHQARPHDSTLTGTGSASAQGPNCLRVPSMKLSVCQIEFVALLVCASLLCIVCGVLPSVARQGSTRRSLARQWRLLLRQLLQHLPHQHAQRSKPSLHA